MAETFAALLLAHVLADYVLQNKWIVESKRGPGFAVHIAIVFSTAALCLGQVSPAVLWITLLHLAIDAAKTLLMPDRLWSYLGDQGLHILSLFAVSAVAPHAWEAGIWSGNVPGWIPAAMAAVAGLVYATRAGQFAVALFLRDIMRLEGAAEPGGRDAMTGIAERTLVFVSILSGWVVAAALLFGGKLAFQAHRGAGRAAMAGTISSFVWAIAVALATGLVLRACQAGGP